MDRIQDSIVDQLIARGIEIDVVAPEAAPTTGVLSLRGNISFMNGEETIVRHPFDPPFAAIAKGMTDTFGEPVYAFGYSGAAAIYALETRLATFMRDGNVLKAPTGFLTLDKGGRLCTQHEYWNRELGPVPTP